MEKTINRCMWAAKAANKIAYYLIEISDLINKNPSLANKEDIGEIKDIFISLEDWKDSCRLMRNKMMEENCKK